MNKEEAREYIVDHPEQYLEKDKTGKGYICPICGSGSGIKGTGITAKDGKHFTCWAGCFSNSDVIDIIGKQNGLTDYNSKLEKACSVYNITLEGNNYKKTSKEDFNTVDQNQPKNKQHTQQNIHNKSYTTKVTQQTEKLDYTSFFLEANKNLNKTDYLRKRGISLEVANRFNLGYVENYRAHNKMAYGWNCLIIPTSKSSYIMRNTDPKADSNNRYRKTGKANLFNIEALKTAQKPIFITEGEIDALSIIEAGGVAVGLGSVSNIQAFLSYVEADKPSQPLILALDNDKAGQEATEKLKNGLISLCLEFYEYNIAGTEKDANGALLHDREKFIESIQETYRQQEAKQEAQLEAERETLQRESVFCSFQDFQNYIKDSKASYIPTGFAEVDKLLDGGLYAGLYVVGAISSLGKTTFCLQVADQIAKNKTDVLIFSLEMAKYELMAKSISRLTFQLDTDKQHHNSKTTRGILTGSRYNKYNEAEKKLIENAKSEYINNISENIYITEGMGDVDIEKIESKVKRHKRITGKAPVVLIDYLQIIKPTEMRATDKQNTDIAVTALKRLSRDYSIPIIAISSFNRENYTEPVNLTSFKESGAVEYSSDVLIGLQYEGMDYQKSEQDNKRKEKIRGIFNENQEKAKAGQAQKIQLKVLKNRNGSKGSCNLYYVPMFNYFFENMGFEEQEELEEGKIFDSGF